MTSLRQNFIQGRWITSRGAPFVNTNPADSRQTLGHFPESTPEDLEKAVTAAQEAFESWRLTPVPRRADILMRAGLLLERHKERLALIMTREMGKVLKETRGDIQEAIDMAYYVAGEGRRLDGQTLPSELKNKAAMTFRMPIGVCGLITPWNFPMAIPSWKILPAVICGNTVILKPAEDTPQSALEFVKILHEAGMPPGVVNLVFGGAETGQRMILHQGIRLMSFTGSCDVGRIVAEQCGRQLKRCSLEMGGKNAQIILRDADVDLALEGALWGAFGTSGQRCTATSRIYVDRKIYASFVKTFVAQARKIKIGPGWKNGIEMGPVINQSQLNRIHAYVESGISEGARLECGGSRARGRDVDPGFFYLPTVFTDVRPEMKIIREEIFGPVTCIIPVKGFDDALAQVNDTQYGLSTSIYTRDVNLAMRAIRDLESGITYVNGPTIGAEVHLPFGGIKNTGNGHREAGRTALDIFSEWKSVYIDFSGRLQKAQIDV